MKWGQAHVNLLVRGFEIDTFFHLKRHKMKQNFQNISRFNELDQAPSVVVK
jgi:hypothetical protein